jgi:hypothetical protein
MNIPIVNLFVECLLYLELLFDFVCVHHEGWMDDFRDALHFVVLVLSLFDWWRILTRKFPTDRNILSRWAIQKMRARN